MNFKLPHWITILAAVAAAALVALSQQPQFATYAALLNSLALIVGSVGTGVALHAPSIVHAANVQAVVGYEKAHTVERGFVRVGPLLTLATLATLATLGLFFALAGCARLKAAAPEEGTLLACVSTFVANNISMDLKVLVVSLAIQCGADVGDVLQAILDSKDPNLAQYKTAAAAAKASPDVVARLRVHALSHHHDAGAP